LEGALEAEGAPQAKGASEAAGGTAIRTDRGSVGIALGIPVGITLGMALGSGRLNSTTSKTTTPRHNATHPATTRGRFLVRLDELTDRRDINVRVSQPNPTQTKVTFGSWR